MIQAYRYPVRHVIISHLLFVIHVSNFFLVMFACVYVPSIQHNSYYDYDYFVFIPILFLIRLSRWYAWSIFYLWTFYNTNLLLFRIMIRKMKGILFSFFVYTVGSQFILFSFSYLLVCYVYFACYFVHPSLQTSISEYLNLNNKAFIGVNKNKNISGVV